MLAIGSFFGLILGFLTVVFLAMFEWSSSNVETRICSSPWHYHGLVLRYYVHSGCGDVDACLIVVISVYRFLSFLVSCKARDQLSFTDVDGNDILKGRCSCCLYVSNYRY
jgi:hypothetical protein